MVNAVRETFDNRHTSLDEVVAFEDGFADDPLRKSRWNSFVKKKKPMLPITFSDTIIMIQKFMGPVIDAIRQGTNLESNWSHEQQEWIRA